MKATTKTFARRDSATAILRKAGVAKADYNQYITVSEQGQFVLTMPTTEASAGVVDQEVVQQGDAAANAAELEGAAAAEETVEAKPVKGVKGKKVPAVKPAKAAKVEKAPRVSVASRARELILAGNDNEAVFAILVTEFKLGADKKHYPGWYRSQLKRDGKLV